jgi:predicted CXXCH cytochrome family protein
VLIDKRKLAAFILCLCAGLLPHGQGLAATVEGFVGSETCAGCHQAEHNRWRGSHHDLAMLPASPGSVLGDFDDAELDHHGVISSFFRAGERFIVRTDGSDGRLQDFEVRYTFGAFPLQQYLVELPGGRLQALSVAWDSRPAEEGGQRWFHLYPDEKISHDDVLHWTQPSQNWNSRCAECHSTGLDKNYDAETRSFDTTWAEVNVACEACHGPGSDHLHWARRDAGWQQFEKDRGLRVRLDERRGVHWRFDAEASIARRSAARDSAREIETCARCHARRSPISDGFRHGEPLLDHYLPALLADGLYYPDGQIDDEVYVYGSFMQSKMQAAGVTCSDCHDPHSLELRAPGNAVCLQCHRATDYDVGKHHFHQAGSSGASCAECHMPARSYMVVDPRHDHSMRIPRPDLSVAIGTPNACTNCHVDKSDQWAAEQVSEWYGDPKPGYQGYAKTLHAARRAESSGDDLAALVRDTDAPAIARATALSAIGPYLDNSNVDTLRIGLADIDPAVRAATLGALEAIPPQLRVQFAFPLLRDPVRAVRIEAARVLATIPVGDLPAEQRRVLDAADREYIAAQLASAERPEAQTNLGNFYAAKGERKPAIEAYRTAMELAPYYLPAYINLADFYRRVGLESDALELLQQAVARNPGNASAHHALGLSLVRLQRYDAALAELARAAELAPEDAVIVYVYAVALNSMGQPQNAIAVLQRALEQHPRNREILGALVSFSRDSGDAAGARRYAEQLRALGP